MFLNDEDVEAMRELLSIPKSTVQPPGPLDFQPTGLPRRWKKWKRKFNKYVEAIEEDIIKGSHVSGPDDPFWVALLMYLLGEQSDEIFLWLEWRGWTQDHTLQQTIQRLNAHLSRMANTHNNVFIRLNFHRRFQTTGESITEYIKAIEFLAKLCNFGESLEMMMRDKMVVGIMSDSTREKMFAFDDMLTFENACMIAFNDEIRNARRPG